MIHQITTDHKSVTDELLHLLSGLSGERLNIKPAAGRWSAAQVCDHINKSDKFVLSVLEGGAEPADRDPQKQIAPIRDLFLDFSTKFKAPDVSVPGEGVYVSEEVQQRLKSSRAKLEEASRWPELQLICTDSEFPGMGKLSRIEWLYFSVYHAQRHLHQLRRTVSS
jgi:hypothetical protein